jgi:hypothetical protein
MLSWLEMTLMSAPRIHPKWSMKTSCGTFKEHPDAQLDPNMIPADIVPYLQGEDVDIAVAKRSLVRTLPLRDKSVPANGRG